MDSPPSIIAPTAAENEPMNEESKSVNSTASLPTTQTSPSSPHSTTVRFFNPSAYEIEECCKKLNLPYFSDAYTFWSKTVIKEISSTSIPNQLYSVVNESSGFACLSLFLTGTETNASLINFNFNQKYFIKNLIEIALCHFFECRIGIFADGKWERYGSWDDETANILSFLMKKDGDKFCPILSLMQ
uniref:Uncharacterized protein n=1 Tax=Panagrolaimus sp. ES5 TaxID=591445 RepID=A0AC34G3L1_9BILA